MRPLSGDAYKVFIELLKGNYRNPVSQRSKAEKNAIILFWRRRSRLEIKEDKLFYDGKVVVKESDLRNKVKQSVRSIKGGGARSVAYSLKEKYAGVSERLKSERC
ncbi:hypothetical protein DPMN_109113 [Dreissena polymorpha]|uniref:Uncharacterized protein n=1 Tax=Dreissena polymorpha TaxID=45954 RepID=A0A9D4KAE6_DREPO|nr:hypothetical protein DPMN_109113 [Dreissena polymorpha]